MTHPGLAFGTGTHPTTSLCLQWLDSLDLTGKTVIDFGCGSGILAIAALKLGAAKAIGIDIDPQAIQASRDNAERTLAYGRGPGSFTGVRIGIGIAQGLALGAELPMIGVSTLMTMAQGAWRKNGATRVLAAIDARMGEVYWAEYQRDENGIWHGEETEAVLKPEIVHERMQQLSGEWVTVGTGWQAWPDLGKESGLVLRDGEVLLPAAEDMLPIACQMFAEGKTVAVEHAEPVYLRNNVAWKKLPGKE